MELLTIEDVLSGLSNKNGDVSINFELERLCQIGLSLIYSNLVWVGFNDYNAKRIVCSIAKDVFGQAEARYLRIKLEEPIDPCSNDVLGNVYEQCIHKNGTRKNTGQFYSPIGVIEYMVNALWLDKVLAVQNKKIIDIACGSGLFLAITATKVMSILKHDGAAAHDILQTICNNFFGLDINPVSCMITKINLMLVIINELGKDSYLITEGICLNVYETNSIENRDPNENDMTINHIKNKVGMYENGFDYILGNPPYLQAKGMPADVKEACRENYPNTVTGAFDLYIAFISQCNRLVSEDGIVSLILPNKFSVAKYALKLRRQLIEEFSILELIDLSEMDVFYKTDVYPIVFTYRKRVPGKQHMIGTKMSVKSYHELTDNRKVLMPQMNYKDIGSFSTFYWMPYRGEFKKLFADIFESSRPLSDFVCLRSAVSFHEKGLREQYVGKKFGENDANELQKYLGGQSFSRFSEVEKYRTNWQGYYINYDEESLKQKGNSVPVLSLFQQEKIIFCQHAQMLTATYDEKGEWVTKDVYPIAVKKPGSVLSLKYLTGLFNSKLFSFIYGILYKGVQISAGYYHFLPSWMECLPVIAPGNTEMNFVEQLVDEALKNDNGQDRINISQSIDEVIYKIYGVDSLHQKEIERFFERLW
ncbi:MAG: N-6 DNA methylase [Bacillota bacterium]|nr:N-6 DNA methylase [Bacillota bacterium]